MCRGDECLRVVAAPPRNQLSIRAGGARYGSRLSSTLACSWRSWGLASAESRALQADALDFFGDAANYAISLGVAGLALVWRARAALVKGVTLVALGGYVMISALFAVVGGAPPARIMGAVGMTALAANVGVALMLYRFRKATRTCARCGSAHATTPSPISLC